MPSEHIAYEKLISFAAGEVDFAEAKAVETHIAFCAECNQTVSLFKTIRHLVRTDDGQSPPVETVNRAYSIFALAASNSQHVSYEQLIAFVAGELAATDTRPIVNHLAVCAACGQTVTRMKTIHAAARANVWDQPARAVVARAYAIFTQKRPAAVPFWKHLGLDIRLPSTRRFSMAVVLVLLVLSNILVFTGMSKAVDNSNAALPGDTFYPTKLALEDIQMATTFDTVGKILRHTTFAGYRVDETAALVTLDRVLEIPGTLAAFQKETNLVSATFKILARENFRRAQDLAPQIEATLSEYSTKLETIRQTVAAAAQPAFVNAIQASTASLVAVHASSFPPPPTATPTLEALPTYTRVIDIPPTLRVISTATRVLGPQPAPLVVPTPTNVPPAVLPPAPTNVPPVVLPPTWTPVPTKTPQPIIVSTPTPVPTKPIIVSTPTATRPVVVPSPTRTQPPPTATRTVVVPTATRTRPPPIETRTAVAPTPTKTPAPTQTRKPTDDDHH